MILADVEKDKNQILKEAVDLLDVIQGEFDKYKTEKFSELVKEVKDYIDGQSLDKKSKEIRKFNQGLWVKTGTNFIFDVDVYRKGRQKNDETRLKFLRRATVDDVYSKGKQKNDKAGSLRYIDISQLYHKTSRRWRGRGGPTGGYAAFFNATYKTLWENGENSGKNNSINPKTPTSETETLLDFYKTLSADSKRIRFKGKEIEFVLPEGVQVTSKNELTVEAVVQLFKHVMAGGENSIYEKAKAEAEKEEPEPEVAAPEAEKEEPEPEVAARSARRRRARRGSTAALDQRYNIRVAPKEDWIGGYQSKLRTFYTENKATEAFANEYRADKLTSDGRYGFGTHYATIKAAENIISQLEKHLNIKAPEATPANERRIKQLSKLLETKLVGSELNLFNEQDALDTGKKKELEALLKKLRQIKGRLTAAYDKNKKPTADKFVLRNDLVEFNKILSMLLWTNGKIDFDAVYENMQTAVATKRGTGTEKEKVAQVARTIRGTCWFDFDPNVGGIRSGTPIDIWAAAGANFEEWYRQIVELFNYEGASPQFNYKSNAAAQGRLKGAPSKLNDNKTQSISLACLSIHMTKLAENFYKNGEIATRLLFQAKGTNDEAKINKVRDGAKYFLKGDTYEGSVAHGLEQVLNRVIDILRSFRRGQIQQAIKTLAPSSKATEDAREAARKVVAYAKRDEKAIEELARKAKAREAAKPAPAPAGAAAGAAGAPPAKPAAALKAPAASAPAAKPAAATQQESLKQRREKLLNEAIFKKLVR